MARNEGNRRIGYPAPAFLPGGDTIPEMILEVHEDAGDGGTSAAALGYGIQPEHDTAGGDPAQPCRESGYRPVRILSPRKLPDDE